MLFLAVLFRHVPCLQFLATTARPLIPVDVSTATAARPLPLLGREPLLQTVLLDPFEIRFHGPMMRPLVVHEIMQPLTGILATEAAEINRFLFGALSELTLLDGRVARPEARRAWAQC